MSRTPPDQYLLKAAAAEAIADQHADGFLKRSWLDIAQGYRDLARAEQGRTGATEERLANPSS